MTVRRYVPLSGTLLVALIALAVVLSGSTPESTASGAKVAAYADGHQARLFAASFVFTAAALLVVFFASTLARSLAPAQDDRLWIWDRVLFGGGVLFGAALGMVGAMNFAIADSPTKVSESALQALNLLLNDTWVFWNAALGVFMLGAAGACLAQRVRRPGWIALVLGIALFIPFADFFALLASGIWIVGVSVAVYRQQHRPAGGAVPSLA